MTIPRQERIEAIKRFFAWRSNQRATFLSDLDALNAYSDHLELLELRNGVTDD